MWEAICCPCRVASQRIISIVPGSTGENNESDLGARGSPNRTHATSKAVGNNGTEGDQDGRKTTSSGRGGWNTLDKRLDDNGDLLPPDRSHMCPLSDLQIPGPDAIVVSTCPFHKHKAVSEFLRNTAAATPASEHRQQPPNSHGVVKTTVFAAKQPPIAALNIVDGAFAKSDASAALLAQIGGGDMVRMFCTRFYARVFQDKQIEPFFFSGDGSVGHGLRLGDWIIEQMGGEGTPWFDSGRWGSREAQHMEGWWNHKRAPELQGVPFKLDDCRVWMRLHFWAVRECGLAEKVPAFWQWHINFISHFVRIYEPKAPPYAPADAEWSASRANIDAYAQQGNLMIDIVGIGRD